MSGYRLREYGRLGGIDMPTVYENVDDAAVGARRLIDALEDRPTRRPWKVQVFDIETGEVVITVRPLSTKHDPDPFASETDPAPRLQGGTSSSGGSVELPAHNPPPEDDN